MECAPGQELQVDFGQGAWVIQEGKRRRPHLFRAVLSHSRKAYSEAVWRQTSESFLRCLENAFRYFGGVTATVVPDNLKKSFSAGPVHSVSKNDGSPFLASNPLVRDFWRRRLRPAAKRIGRCTRGAANEDGSARVINAAVLAKPEGGIRHFL